MAILLDGKRRAEQISRLLKKEIDYLKRNYRQTPKLVTLQIGKGAASSLYINAQKRLAEKIGLGYELISVNETATEDTILSIVNNLNITASVTGIILQRPLPKKINSDKIYSSIPAIKDVEGVSFQNLGRLFFENRLIMPPTVSAIMELIRLSSIKLYGREAVVVGHSEIVGKPLAIALLNEFATVSVCHIATSERKILSDYVKRAEVLIVAVGKPNLIKGKWIKKGAVVIDVGINNVGGKIVGDVEFHEAKKRASYISPVPGGVGPLTTIMLMQNCVNLFKLQKGIR